MRELTDPLEYGRTDPSRPETRRWGSSPRLCGTNKYTFGTPFPSPQNCNYQDSITPTQVLIGLDRRFHPPHPAAQCDCVGLTPGGCAYTAFEIAPAVQVGRTRVGLVKEVSGPAGTPWSVTNEDRTETGPTRRICPPASYSADCDEPAALLRAGGPALGVTSSNPRRDLSSYCRAACRG